MSECAKMCGKSANFEMAYFLHFIKIAQLLFQKGRMCENVQKMRFLNHTFLLLKKGDRTFSMIALFKVRKKSNLKICTFCAHFHTFAHFKRGIV